MAQSLNAVASILTDGRQDALALDWSQLRHQHTAAVRAALAERYKPATANKILASLRGVLKECWRLGQMSAEDHARAADLPAVRGSTLPRGRALSAGELRALFAACANDETPAGACDACSPPCTAAASVARKRSPSTSCAPRREPGRASWHA